MLFRFTHQNEGAGGLHPYVFVFDAQFSCEDLDDARLAETALAFSHSGTDTAFDSANGRRTAVSVNAVEYFAFRDHLAAADDVSEFRILFDKFCSFFRRHAVQTDHGTAAWVEIGLFLHFHRIGEEFDDFFCDGRAGRQTGGLNADEVDETGERLLDDEVPALFDRTQAGEFTDDLIHRDRRHEFFRGGQDLRKCLAIGRVVVFFFDEFRRRSQNVVAVRRGADEDPFPFRGWDREDGVADKIRIEMVQDEILALSRLDLVFDGIHEIIDLVREKTGCVDDGAGLVNRAVRRDFVSALNSADARDGFVQVEFDPIVHRVFHQRDAQFESVHDPGGRREKREFNFRREIRLQRERFFPAEHLDRHTVLPAAFFKPAEDLDFFVVRSDGQRADLPHIDVEFLAHLIVEQISAHVHRSFFTAGDRVVSGVDDGRVGGGGDFADVAFFFKDQNVKLILRQRTCRSGTNGSGSDDDEVFHGFKWVSE